MKLYFSFLKMQIKRQLQYKLSLALMFFAQMLTTVLMLLTIYLLMDRFNVVDGWNFKQILLTYGVVMFAFSFTECFFRGMDRFASFIKSGSVDRMLVRPRGIVHQALCCDIELSKFGRCIVAVATLIYAMCIQDFTWTFGKVMILIGMCVCGIVVFLGLCWVLRGQYSQLTELRLLTFLLTAEENFVNIHSISMATNSKKYSPLSYHMLVLMFCL